MRYSFFPISRTAS